MLEAQDVTLGTTEPKVSCQRGDTPLLDTPRADASQAQSVIPIPLAAPITFHDQAIASPVRTCRRSITYILYAHGTDNRCT